jgi:hypothetical protein
MVMINYESTQHALLKIAKLVAVTSKQSDCILTCPVAAKVKTNIINAV